MNDPGNQSGLAAGSSASRNDNCAKADPLIDVLFEQLGYLVDHAGQACPPGCPDCARLEAAKDWLLIPFQSVGYRPIEIGVSRPEA